MAQATTQPQEGLPEIAGYKVLRILGQGGMSIVYLAQQLSLGREVAIKVMRPDVVGDETGRRRFENEARTIARLDHPHIVHIHEVGRTADGLPYQVMPVLPRGHLGRRTLTHDENRIRQILEAMLSALAYAHSRGIVHRDVKAENVLFDEADRPMLTDFGIALRRGYGSRVTTAGMAVGSTAYMAPEQARGGDVDLRADLYSLGVLAWEMLTGGLPYKASDGLSMALMHVQDPIPRLPSHLAHWQLFFDRALAKQPIDRFPDAAGMLEALRAVPNAQRDPLRAAIARLRARMGLREVAIATVALALVVGGIAWLAHLDRQRTAEALARLQPQGAGEADAIAGIDPTLGAPLIDPTASLPAGAPSSPAERLIGTAQTQLRAGRLIAPAGNSAYDSVMTAWRLDPSHAALPEITRRVLNALATETGKRLERGDDAGVRDLLSRMTRLAEQDRAGGTAQIQRIRRELDTTLGKRMDAAVDAYDRDAARKVVASARLLGLDRSRVAALEARAEGIAKPGDRVKDPLGELTLVLNNDRMVGVPGVAISRGKYAEFARATGRAPALCREKASPLRLLAPRTWESPGFDQGPNGPVVCVSWQDADAFARWYSQRTGTKYRLPTAAEAQQVGRSDGAKSVGEWVSDCAANGCTRRVTLGRTWRGANGSRPLDAQRGYDDVGFRLVRE